MIPPVAGVVRQRVRLLSVTLLAASLASGMVAAGAAAVRAAATSLGVLAISTQQYVGETDLILQLLDADHAPVVDPALEVTVILVAPDGTAHDPVPAELRRLAVRGRDLWLARVTYDAAGSWTGVVTATGPDGSRTGSVPIVVSPDGATPPLGSAAPDTDTPTLNDVLNLADAISSDPRQVAAFYWHSVHDQLLNGQPFVFVLDTYVYRPNEACGGALGLIHDIFIEYPELTVIHAEPWVTRFSAGALTLEPPEGPAALAPWSVAYGIEGPPWVFIIDREGRVHQKLTGVFGSDELRAAMGEIATWVPLGAPATQAPPVTG